jgi:transcriptional regulator with XRE-family HTH domain
MAHTEELLITGEESASLIKSLREKYKMTQRELAARAGVSPSLIAYVESGRSIPTVENFSKVITALGGKLYLHCKIEN